MDVETLQEWTAQLLLASGVGESAARDAAEVFALATLRGLGHHDVSYLPQRLDWLATGQVKAKPHLSRVYQAPASEVWDGDGGLGEALCHHVTIRAMTLARTQGVGYASVRRSNHFLAAAPYTEIGSREGFLLVVWSNTDAGMGLPNGHTRQIGNNPLGFGIGTGMDGLSADLSLAYSSLGNLHALAATGQSVPSHWGRNADDQVAATAQELLEGAVGPIGGHKGLSLALLGEVLRGVLSGGTTLDEIATGGGLNTHNQMALAFDLDAFGGRGPVLERVASLRSRASAVAHGGRLPGERSHRAAAQALEHGLVLAPGVVAALTDWSARLGVAIPSH